MIRERILQAEKDGWVLVDAGETSMVLRCPSQGCGLKIRVPYDKPVPHCDPGIRRNPGDIPVGSYEDFLATVVHRRHEMALTIRETEEIAGLTADHIAKFEQRAGQSNRRTASFESMVLWAAALGFEFVLRPSPLPRAAVRVLSETRDKVADRRKISARHRAARSRDAPSSG